LAQQFKRQLRVWLW